MVLQQYPNLETLLLKSKSKRSINRSSSIEENESQMLQDSVRHENRIRPASENVLPQNYIGPTANNNVAELAPLVEQSTIFQRRVNLGQVFNNQN